MLREEARQPDSLGRKSGGESQTHSSVSGTDASCGGKQGAPGVGGEGGERMCGRRH